MRRDRYEPEEAPRGLLIFAAGALAGAAAGAYFARRYRTREEFFDDVRDKLASLREYWDRAAEFESNGRHERDLVDAYEGEDDFVDEYEPHFEMSGTHAIAAVGHEPDSEDEPASSPLPNRDRTPERALESRVLSAFRDDEVLSERAIDISAVDGGVVELAGWVRSLDEAARAATVARQVPGVSLVLNRVGIRAGAGTNVEGAAADLPPDVEVERSSEEEGPAA
jgi:BON domain-containing protein